MCCRVTNLGQRDCRCCNRVERRCTPSELQACFDLLLLLVSRACLSSSSALFFCCVDQKHKIPRHGDTESPGCRVETAVVRQRERQLNLFTPERLHVRISKQRALQNTPRSRPVYTAPYRDARAFQPGHAHCIPSSSRLISHTVTLSFRPILESSL